MDEELEIKAYYAGHVLGAAMFHIKVGQQSVVYTVSIAVYLKNLHSYVSILSVQLPAIIINSDVG